MKAKWGDWRETLKTGRWRKGVHRVVREEASVEAPTFWLQC